MKKYISYTFEYRDNGKWRRSRCQTDTLEQVKELIYIIGAKQNRIIKMATTIKEKIVRK